MALIPVDRKGFHEGANISEQIIDLNDKLIGLCTLTSTSVLKGYIREKDEEGKLISTSGGMSGCSGSGLFNHGEMTALHLGTFEAEKLYNQNRASESASEEAITRISQLSKEKCSFEGECSRNLFNLINQTSRTPITYVISSQVFLENNKFVLAKNICFN